MTKGIIDVFDCLQHLHQISHKYFSIKTKRTYDATIDYSSDNYNKNKTKKSYIFPANND